MYDIVILTDDRYTNPKKTNWYIDQVLLEDQILLDELKKNKLKAIKKSWSDPTFNWANTKYAIFRSTWDYFDRFDDFFKWIKKTQKLTEFINSSEIINWNINKYYLKDLKNNFINIIPTIFIKKGEKTTLSQLMNESGFSEDINE